MVTSIVSENPYPIMSIKMYGTLVVCHSPKPTDGRPPASSQKMKEEIGEHIGASFSFAFTVYSSLFNSQCYITILLLTRQKRASSILPAEQKKSVKVIESDI